jgi:hypothetical protein
MVVHMLQLGSDVIKQRQGRRMGLRGEGDRGRLAKSLKLVVQMVNFEFQV